MSEKLCLQCNGTTFKRASRVDFKNLREDKSFADVTLAYEDGEQVKAILAEELNSSKNFLKIK